MPGFSIHNREWALEVQKHLLSSTVWEWKHWKTHNNRDFNAKNEAKLMLDKIDTRVNILAKSAGTIVAMYLLALSPSKVNKIILCGIPVNWENMDSLSRKSYEILKNFSTEKILIFQNTCDPYANFEVVRNNIAKINQKIEVIEKPRADHEYPYFEDFSSFLMF